MFNLNTALGSDGQGPQGFSFVFLEFSGCLFASSGLFTDSGAGMFGLLGASIELVRVRASAHGSHNRTLTHRDRETGPDLRACAARSRASLRNVISTKLN